MLDGILNQRLKRQARYIDSEKVSRYVHVDFQPIMKACLFDLQIFADKLELALQGDLVLAPFEAIRSKSPRLTSRWLAASTSSCIRTPMVWRLLNKKCGCNWLLRFSSSAWESCVSSCAARV